MPEMFQADNEPTLIQALRAPEPDDILDAYDTRDLIKGVLNLAKWVGGRVNAAKLGGLLPDDFWKKSEALPGGMDGVSRFEVSTVFRVDEANPITGGGLEWLLKIPAYINQTGAAPASPRAVHLKAFRLHVDGLSVTAPGGVVITGGSGALAIEVRAISQMVAPPTDATSTDLAAPAFEAPQSNVGGGFNYGKSGLNIPLTDVASFMIYANGPSTSALTAGVFTLWALIEVEQ